MNQCWSKKNQRNSSSKIIKGEDANVLSCTHSESSKRHVQGFRCTTKTSKHSVEAQGAKALAVTYLPWLLTSCLWGEVEVRVTVSKCPLRLVHFGANLQVYEMCGAPCEDRSRSDCCMVRTLTSTGVTSFFILLMSTLVLLMAT